MTNGNQPTWKSDAKWAIALLFFAVLGLSGLNYGAWSCPVGPQEASEAAVCQRVSPEGPGVENLAALTDTLLEKAEAGAEDGALDGSAGQVVALEALAVLLVGALIGALVIALQEPEFDEGGAT